MAPKANLCSYCTKYFDPITRGDISFTSCLDSSFAHFLLFCKYFRLQRFLWNYGHAFSTDLETNGNSYEHVVQWYADCRIGIKLKILTKDEMLSSTGYMACLWVKMFVFSFGLWKCCSKMLSIISVEHVLLISFIVRCVTHKGVFRACFRRFEVVSYCNHHLSFGMVVDISSPIM